MAGTKEDAQLIIQLAQWGATLGMPDSVSALLDDAFDPESASAGDPDVRTVLNFFETVGTLVKNDLLDRELVHDWLWIGGMWDRVAPAVRKARERFGEPRLGENFEALASG